MDTLEVLKAIVDSDDEIDWNESSPECSDDEEDEIVNLPDPLSDAEVGPPVFINTILITMLFCSAKVVCILLCGGLFCWLICSTSLVAKQDKPYTGWFNFPTASIHWGGFCA